MGFKLITISNAKFIIVIKWHGLIRAGVIILCPHGL
jgi:hypothetical protein